MIAKDASRWAIEGQPVHEIASTPGPWYSTMAPVPPLTVKMPATLQMTSLGDVHRDNLPVNRTPITWYHDSGEGCVMTTQAQAATSRLLDRAALDSSSLSLSGGMCTSTCELKYLGGLQLPGEPCHDIYCISASYTHSTHAQPSSIGCV